MEFTVNLKINENQFRQGLELLVEQGLLTTENVIELTLSCVEVSSQ